MAEEIVPHVRPNCGGRPLCTPVQHPKESPMSQTGTHLVGLFDLCLAELSFLIAVPACYVALDVAAYLRPARGEVPWMSNKLMSPDLDSDHTEASAVPWNQARVMNRSWRARLRCAIQAR